MAPPATNKQDVRLRSDEEKTKWKTLFKLVSQPSRYPTLTATRGLGIQRSWDDLLQAGELTQLFSMKYHSYHALTVEFLSTLQVKMNGREIESISFRLRNGEYTLTVAQFNTIFQFYGEEDGAIWKEPEAYDRHAFWEAIAISEDPELGYSSKAKNNELRNPVLRYLHKALVYLPFAHKEAGGLQFEELFVLWGLLYGQRINMGHLMIKFLERQTKKDSGKLYFGGVITRLAAALDVNLEGLVPDIGTIIIDWDVLKTTKIIMVDGRGQGYFLQNAKDHFPFPNAQLTAVGGWQYRDNWLMNTEAHAQVVASNPPVGKAKANRDPIIPWNIEDPVFPEQRLQLPGPQQEGPSDNVERGEGSRQRRKRRNDPVEAHLQMMNERLGDLNLSMKQGFVRQDERLGHLYTMLQQEAEQQGVFRNAYYVNQEAEAQWHQKVRQMFSSWPHYPPPPPQ